MKKGIEAAQICIGAARRRAYSSFMAGWRSSESVFRRVGSMRVLSSGLLQQAEVCRTAVVDVEWLILLDLVEIAKGSR